jgi:hypothetical protein
LSFTVTGESGTTGFGNITIPKSAVPYGTTPTIYIDGPPASNQGYTKDATNFYVWYTTQISTHLVTIQFTAPSPTPTPTPSPTPLYLVLAAVITVAVVLILIFTVIAIKRSRRKPDEALPSPEN